MRTYSLRFEGTNLAEVSFNAAGTTEALARAKRLSRQQKVSLWDEGQKVCTMYPPRSSNGNWMPSLV